MPSASIPAALGLTAAAAEGGTIAIGAGATSAALASAVATAAPIATAAATSTASILSTAGLIASGASGVLGAVGALTSANARKDAANYQAQVDANNRKIADYRAADTERVGDSKLEREGMLQRQRLGALETAQAASGVDINSGSAVDIRKSQRMLDQFDALTIASNTARESYGYTLAGTGFDAQAQLQRSQASHEDTTAALGVTGSLLSGATGVSNQYLGWRRVSGSPPALFG